VYVCVCVCHCREAPQLAALLKEMKGGLDTVRSKVQALTAKVGMGMSPILSLVYI
jgi:hypothetical protein